MAEAVSVGAGTPAAIAFMHIPKTAGTSVGEAFCAALGADQCLVRHPTLVDADFACHRFVASHQMLCTVTPNAFRFTFLRNPLAQLASHLRWLDRYNNPVFWEEVLLFSPEIRALFKRVGTVDFGSAESLAAFFAWLPHDSPVRLPNVQAECLAARTDRVDYHNEAELAALAIANLGQLDFVGIVERGARDLRRLFRRLDLGRPPALGRHNTLSSKRTINLADPAIRAVLAGQVGADLRLYAFATPPWWRRPLG